MIDSEWVVLLMMLFFHLLEDFHLQGCLANMKQKDFWKKSTNESNYKLYKNDWCISLIAHCVEWSIMMMLPIMVFNNFEIDKAFVIVFILNIVIHFIVDDYKCNKHKINLWVDQLCHMVQIFCTWLILIK